MILKNQSRCFDHVETIARIFMTCPSTSNVFYRDWYDGVYDVITIGHFINYDTISLDTQNDFKIQDLRIHE